MVSDVVKTADIRTKTDDELRIFVRDKEQELLKLKFQHATGQLENTARIRLVRKELARAKTVQGSKAAPQAKRN